jgi:pyruvate dehydrogenase E2 component (dihydrolipoamide acetyltransferase)
MPDVKLPDLGENIESADVVSILVKEGDVIKREQDVIEIETEKAVMAVPADDAGKVTKIHVARGQTIKPGQVIISLEAATAGTETAKAAAPTKEAAAPPKAQPTAAKTSTQPKAPAPAPPAKPQAAAKPKVAKPQPAQAPAAAQAKTASPEPETAHENGRHVATPDRSSPVESAAPEAESGDGHPATVSPAGPAVRRLARELGVDLARVQGTGEGGRITRDDVVNAVRHANIVAAKSGAAAGAPVEEERDDYGPIRRETMTKIRKTIAANMVRSASTIPHLTNFDDADITELERLRKESALAYADSGIKLTQLAFVLKAIALALKQHPTLNASVDLDAAEITYKHYVNLGVAVDTDRGLIVPVLRAADTLSIPQIAQGIQTLADKVRGGRQTLDDLRGGTFTISNLGAVGGQYSTPIINYPEVAILLVGRSRKMPVVTLEDKVEPRLLMPLSLSYDHRLVDGAAASRFLNEVIGYLESPGRLLLAP